MALFFHWLLRARERLGIAGRESRIEINGRRVRVAGMVRELRGLAGSYVFCSLAAASIW